MTNCVFEKYKNKHIGERVFLIGNGPSLADTDLSLLEGENSIAMNRVSLIYDKNPEWRPTYYLFSSTNVRASKPWHQKWRHSVTEAVKSDQTTSFIAEIFRNDIDPHNKYKSIKWFSKMSENKPDAFGNIHESCFSTDIVERIDKTGTTMNLALQLVYHMGFSEVVFLGADLGWKHDRASTKDPNHFSSDYTADIPRPEKANNQMRNIHSLAVKKFRENKKGVKFYNASLKTVLDVYPIINFEEYINKNEIVYRPDDMRVAKDFWDDEYQFDGINYDDFK